MPGLPGATVGQLPRGLDPLRHPSHRRHNHPSRSRGCALLFLYLQRLIDALFLDLTPGTRSGVIHDERYVALLGALKPLEGNVGALIEAHQRAV